MRASSTTLPSSSCRMYAACSSINRLHGAAASTTTATAAAGRCPCLCSARAVVVLPLRIRAHVQLEAVWVGVVRVVSAVAQHLAPLCARDQARVGPEHIDAYACGGAGKPSTARLVGHRAVAMMRQSRKHTGFKHRAGYPPAAAPISAASLSMLMVFLQYPFSVDAAAAGVTAWKPLRLRAAGDAEPAR
jgi:hypothetical protein